MKYTFLILLFAIYLKAHAQSPLTRISSSRQYFVSGHPSGGAGYNFELKALVNADSLSVTRVWLDGQAVEYVTPKEIWHRGDTLYVKVVIRLLSGRSVRFDKSQMVLWLNSSGKASRFRISRFTEKKEFKGQ